MTVDATVNNYATADIEELSGGGTLTQIGNDYTLALGTIDLDSQSPDIDLGIANTATGPADLLVGSLGVSGNADGAFINSSHGVPCRRSGRYGRWRNDKSFDVD